MIQIIIWVGVAVLTAWLYLQRKYNYFKRHGINHMPVLYGLGNMYDILAKKDFSFYIVDKLYRAYPNDRFVGIYEFVTPTIFLKDIELIKLIGVKDFDNFTDHRTITTKNDPILAKGLFGMKGQKWRSMRSTLSPAFTASKLRNMVPFIQESSKDLQDYLTTEIQNNKDKKIEIDVRELMSRYANDVIATCAFGFKINSISDKNNEFYKMGDLLTTFSFKQFFKLLPVLIFPFLEKLVTVEMFSRKAVDYFKNLFLGTMKNREEHNIYRPDMLQMLMEAQKGTLKHDKGLKEEKDAGFATVFESDVGKNTVKESWDEDHIVAQALLFFFAGFDTVSTIMVFLLHELALNPDIQERLQQEIDEAWERYNGKFDYDKINQLKYLDMCISETLRKWPVTAVTDRVAIKDYNMGKPNDNSPDYILPAGTVVTVPTYSIHRDERYYPNPDQFDPERFSDENKHNITAFNYLPFGMGPRNCIGSRFALIEIKTMSISVLRHFNLNPSPKLHLPMCYDKNQLSARIKGGHNLIFTLRTTTRS